MPSSKTSVGASKNPNVEKKIVACEQKEQPLLLLMMMMLLFLFLLLLF